MLGKFSQDRLTFVNTRIGQLENELEILRKERDALEEYQVLENLSTAPKIVNTRERHERIQAMAQAESAPQGTPDSVWETLRKIVAMEELAKIMCEDNTIQPTTIFSAGFRGAVRLAKQALNDAGK